MSTIIQAIKAAADNHDEEYPAGFRLAQELEPVLVAIGPSTAPHLKHQAERLAVAIAVLAFMTDEEFKAISERATKGWLK